jgi:hypothetical protein
MNTKRSTGLFIKKGFEIDVKDKNNLKTSAPLKQKSLNNF